MTAREMSPVIGAIVLIRFEEIGVWCQVQDVKTSYGRTRLLVRPLDGKGTQWVELPRCQQVADLKAQVSA